MTLINFGDSLLDGEEALISRLIKVDRQSPNVSVLTDLTTNESYSVHNQDLMKFVSNALGSWLQNSDTVSQSREFSFSEEVWLKVKGYASHIDNPTAQLPRQKLRPVAKWMWGIVGTGAATAGLVTGGAWLYSTFTTVNLDQGQINGPGVQTRMLLEEGYPRIVFFEPGARVDKGDVLAVLDEATANGSVGFQQEQQLRRYHMDQIEKLNQASENMARLENQIAELEGEKASTERALANAQARLTEARAQSLNQRQSQIQQAQIELTEVRGELNQARAQYEFAQAEAKRYTELHQAGIVTGATLNAKRERAQVLITDIKNAEERIAALKKRFSTLQNGPSYNPTINQIIPFF